MNETIPERSIRRAGCDREVNYDFTKAKYYGLGGSELELLAEHMILK